MNRLKIVVLTSLAMLAFAGNSLLGRFALDNSLIDPFSFTVIRLLTGAITLWVITALKRTSPWRAGNWWSAFFLFVYAACFSFAYLHITAATGALLLFGMVQITMIGQGLLKGERLHCLQSIGILLALSGLVFLLLPGIESPPLESALFMAIAGIAWGVYSLRGQRASNPLAMTAGNFLRSIPFVVILLITTLDQQHLSNMGVLYATCSGALTSGIGYAIWYWVLPALRAITASTIQLSVPLLTAFAGVLFLSEPITFHLVLASMCTLGGIALFLFKKHSIS